MAYTLGEGGRERESVCVNLYIYVYMYSNRVSPKIFYGIHVNIFGDRLV